MYGALLDLLSERSGMFISDIKSQKKSDICDFISKLELNDLPIEEINYSFSYIFNKKFNFKTHDEVRQFLKK